MHTHMYVYMGTEAHIPSKDQFSNILVSFVIKKHYILTHKLVSLSTSLDQQCRNNI